MTAPAPRDDHRPLSAGATALAPQPAPGPRLPGQPPANRPARPRRPAARTAAPEATPAQRPAARAPRARAAAPAVTPRPAPRSRPAILPAGLTGQAARAKAHRAPFVILLLVLMASGLLCLLLLNTALSENAFHAHALQSRAAELARQEQALGVHADQLSAPAALAARASALGMVPGGIPTYLPVDAPVPAGARVVAGSAADGVVLYVLPAPAGPTAAAGSGTRPAATGQAAGGQPPVATPAVQPSAGGGAAPPGTGTGTTHQ
jgi:hypothetical protein